MCGVCARLVAELENWVCFAQKKWCAQDTLRPEFEADWSFRDNHNFGREGQEILRAEGTENVGRR